MKNYSLAQAKDIFMKKRIDIIPVVEASKKVVDVITFNTIFKKNKSTNYSNNFSKTPSL